MSLNNLVFVSLLWRVFSFQGVYQLVSCIQTLKAFCSGPEPLGKFTQLQLLLQGHRDAHQFKRMNCNRNASFLVNAVPFLSDQAKSLKSNTQLTSNPERPPFLHSCSLPGTNHRSYPSFSVQESTRLLLMTSHDQHTATCCPQTNGCKGDSFEILYKKIRSLFKRLQYEESPSFSV